MIATIDTESCTSCGVCLLACPMDVIAVDGSGRYVIAHPEDCMTCFVCELECRPGSIRVEPDRRRKRNLLVALGAPSVE